MKRGFNKLATSPTLEGIKRHISAYYYGEKELREAGPGMWTVHNADGRTLAPFVKETKKGFQFGYNAT